MAVNGLPEKVLKTMPAPLQALVERHWEALNVSAGNNGIALDMNDDDLAGLTKVFALSDFVAASCARDPAMLAALLESGDLQRDYRADEYRRLLANELNDVDDEQDLHRVLRRWRRREMVRLAWRDLAGLGSLQSILMELSRLAEACVDITLAKLDQWQRAEMGVPVDSNGAPQSLVVLGMGKLGAYELNFSSDIDLIFSFPEEGATQDGPREYSNSQYFTRLGQRLINALNNPTEEGFVFRVDMRLRPFGDAGQLAISFDAMETYYQNHGREWERYAMIKARVIAGDTQEGAELMRMLQPFVYRRYLDYSVFESLREMKEMISREVRRRGLEDNVKLGPGGIREVEFIGQAFQLIRGGREPQLQERGIVTVLETLRELEQLPAFVVDNLIEAYEFLRRVENRLQALADRQTHTLPKDEAERLRIATSMNFPDWASFREALHEHMRVVHEHFEQVFAAPQGEAPAPTDTGPAELEVVWAGRLEDDEIQAVLSKTGYRDPAAAANVIAQLRSGSSYQTLRQRGKGRMDRLMPLVLGAIGATDDPDTCLVRIARLIEAIAKRTAYLALLVENPMALSQLVKLVAASPWIADLLTRHPLLLDELLDPRTLYAPLSKAELERELTDRIQALPADDTEAHLDALREFHQAHVLHVAAADVAGATPLMKVSDYLTDIAEVILQQVVELASRHLLERHGPPRCVVDGVEIEAGFGVIAYGKLGGIELGYGSDLDLVFLHDSRGERQYTAGDKSIDNAVFFARLGQRIIHFLTAHTPAGVLYEVDVRLRPSGAAGFLVSSVDSFAEYQRSQAWTWEHQALVRARFVAGDKDVGAKFEAVRRETLGRARDPEALREEVRKMRQRMRDELSRAKLGQFDLKQDPGGIADIEFLVQYGVLRWAHDHPALLTYTDNIRQLEGLAGEGLMTEGDATFLADAYRAYRRRVHQLTLQKASAVVGDGEFATERQGVVAIWAAWMDD